MPLQINTSRAFVVETNPPVKNPGLEYSTHVWRADKAHWARQDSGHVYSKASELELVYVLPSSEAVCTRDYEQNPWAFFNLFLRLHHKTVLLLNVVLSPSSLLPYLVWGSISVLVGEQAETTCLAKPPIFLFPFGWWVVVWSVWSDFHLSAGTKEGIRSLDWCFELG